MKDLSLLVWLTQLGISVVVPLGGCILLAVWLRERFGLGAWVIWAGVILGVLTAADGLISSLKALQRLSREKPEDLPPPTSYNDHD